MEFRCRLLGVSDLPALAWLMGDDGGYSQRVLGRPSHAADAQELLTGQPPNLPVEDKHVLGLFDGDELVAVADVLHGYPTPEHAYLGLLLVAARHHGRGLGRAMHDQVISLVPGWPGVTTIRLAVAETNRDVADPFWTAMGYRPTGEVSSWEASTVRIWERRCS